MGAFFWGPVSPSSDPSISPCWVVGAVVDGRGQTDRLIDEGVRERGFDDDRIGAQVRSMRLGDRTAIKAGLHAKAWPLAFVLGQAGGLATCPLKRDSPAGDRHLRRWQREVCFP